MLYLLSTVKYPYVSPCEVCYLLLTMQADETIRQWIPNSVQVPKEAGGQADMTTTVLFTCAHIVP